MYKAPTFCISAIMLDDSFKKVAGGPRPIQAIDEACRRAVAAELGSQIQALNDATSSEMSLDMEYGIQLAVEQLQRRLTEVTSG